MNAINKNARKSLATSTAMEGAPADFEGFSVPHKELVVPTDGSPLASTGQVASQVEQDIIDQTKADAERIKAEREASAERVRAIYAARKGTADEKRNLAERAKQLFSEAAEYAEKGNDESGKAAETAGRGAAFLFEGVRKGLFDKTEISTILGEKFGWKQRTDKDGRVTDSKTPKGKGEDTRKRIERLRAADEYVSAHFDGDTLRDVPLPNDAGRFFEGMDPEAVKELLETVGPDSEAGQISPWTAYDKLAAIKPKVDTIPLHMNLNKIINLRDKIEDKSVWEDILADDALVLAYRSLYDTLVDLGINVELDPAE